MAVAVAIAVVPDEVHSSGVAGPFRPSLYMTYHEGPRATAIAYNECACYNVILSQEATTMMRITEAAAEIGVCPTTLRRWVRKGLVPCVKTPRNRWFWTQEQVREIRQDMQHKAVAAVGAEA